LALLEVKKTPDGKVLARRTDGQPLTSQDREEAKATIRTQEDLTTIRAWVVEEVRGENGELRAILICSALLEAHLWMILDRSFEPKDTLAIYYAEEIPLLKGKSLEDLREIHKVKLAFPGCRVIQEGAEKEARVTMAEGWFSEMGKMRRKN